MGSAGTQKEKVRVITRMRNPYNHQEVYTALERVRDNMLLEKREKTAMPRLTAVMIEELRKIAECVGSAAQLKLRIYVPNENALKQDTESENTQRRREKRDSHNC